MAQQKKKKKDAPKKESLQEFFKRMSKALAEEMEKDLK